MTRLERRREKVRKRFCSILQDREAVFPKVYRVDEGPE